MIVQNDERFCLLCALKKWWEATTQLTDSMKKAGVFGEDPEIHESEVGLMMRDLEKAWTEFFSSPEQFSQAFHFPEKPNVFVHVHQTSPIPNLKRVQ